MINKVDMNTWIFDSSIERTRFSTYEFYKFMSFCTIDGYDFINIQGNKLGEYLSITMINEYDCSIGGWRWRIIYVGAENLITFAKLMSKDNCSLDKESKGVAVFLAPIVTIVESVIGDIINYLKTHYIEYKA